MQPLIYIASSNAHKLKEFSQMFASAGFPAEIRGASELDGYIPPDEDGESFAANAMIKADALRKIAPPHAYVMADDSGLAVDALGGAPGIHSARYAGVFGSSADASNNEKLLQAMADVSDAARTARFVCVIALICPSGRTETFEGKIEGFIGHKESGGGGFGYDPLFYLPERGKTTAELSAEEKNAISHRGLAFQKLVEFLKKERQSL